MGQDRGCCWPSHLNPETLARISPLLRNHLLSGVSLPTWFFNGEWIHCSNSPWVLLAFYVLTCKQFWTPTLYQIYKNKRGLVSTGPESIAWLRRQMHTSVAPMDIKLGSLSIPGPQTHLGGEFKMQMPGIQPRSAKWRPLSREGESHSICIFNHVPPSLRLVLIPNEDWEPLVLRKEHETWSVVIVL